MADRRFWRIAIAVFAAMAVINYLPILLGNIPFPSDQVVRHSAWIGQPQEQLPELIDIVAMFYPFRALLSRGGEEGTLPLWNPYIMSGAPFQANAQSAVFAPLNVLYYFLPLKLAWTANLVVRLFLAAMFMALFSRSIGASNTGAIVAGIVFALCGFTVQWQGMSNGDSSIWLPLLCYAVHRLHRTPDARSIAIAAFAFAMPVLSGHPETAAHSTAAACAFALFLWLSDGFKPRFVAGFAGAALLAVGLAAIQLIPTLEWMNQLGLQVEAPQPVLDRHQGQGLFSRDITRNPSSSLLQVPEGPAYVGMLGLLAASLALLHPSRRLVWFLLGLAVIAGAVAFGVQPVRWIIVNLPIVKAMKNGRLTLVVDFALAALAALGISAVGRMTRRAMMLLGGSFLVITFCIWEVHRATLSAVGFWRSPQAALLFLAAAFGLLALRQYGRLNDRVFPMLICGLAGVEMLTYSYGYLRFAPAADVFPPAPAIDFIRSRDIATPFRVAKDRFPIPHDAGMIYGFESADGYDLTTAVTRAFTADLIENREDGVMFLAEKILATHDRRFDMLNIKYLMLTTPAPVIGELQATGRFEPVFSERQVTILENKAVLPRWIFVSGAGIEVIADRGAQMARLKDATFDPERSVIVSERPDIGAANSEAVQGRVEVRERSLNGYSLSVESSAPAVLVVSQMYYPGWNASIDGAEARVFPVNVALTGLVVPGGRHDVGLFFQPASFQAGLEVSLVSSIIAGLLLIKARRAPRI